MSKITLQKQEIITLQGLFSAFDYDKASFNFKFAVARNITLLEGMVRDIQKLFQASPEYREYYKKLKHLKLSMLKQKMEFQLNK